MRGAVYVAVVYRFPNGKSKVAVDECQDGESVAKYTGQQNIYAAYLFSSKKAACAYADHWNDFYKSTGMLSM